MELYASQQRYEEQLAQLDVILKFEPSDPLNLHARAQSLYNLKRYDEANEAVNACITVAPANANCAMMQANVLNKLGRKPEAEAAYARALELRKLEQADAMVQKNPLLPRLMPE